MNLLKKVLILLVATLFISGCTMQTNYEMEIKNDKSMDFSVIVAFDDELIDSMLSSSNTTDTGEQNSSATREYTDEERWAFIDSVMSDSSQLEDVGYNIERYDKDGFKGIRATKNIADIDDVTGENPNFDLADYETVGNAVMFAKNGDNYKANLILAAPEQTQEYTTFYSSGIISEFVVTLPSKPVSHNATSVSDDGKTLTWNLTGTGSQSIEFEFAFNNNLWLYIVLGIIVIVVIVMVVVLLLKRKNSKNKGVKTVAPVTSGQLNKGAINMAATAQKNSGPIMPASGVNSDESTLNINPAEPQMGPVSQPKTVANQPLSDSVAPSSQNLFTDSSDDAAEILDLNKDSKA